MKRYSVEEIYPRSQLGKCMIYFNMSHHYRRIYSAKARVDTNLPKKPKPEFCCSSPDVFNFVRRNCMKTPVTPTPRHRVCLKQEEEKHPLFKPRILPTKVESKLKSMPIYQPPKRITPKRVTLQTKPSENTNAQENPKPEVEEDDKRVLNGNPPPDMNDYVSILQNEKDEKEKSMESSLIKSVHEEPRPVDKTTVLFLKDITDDILRKGIYTNKSLEKLFLHHVRKNKYSLTKEIMEKELEKLKVELDMPLDDEKTPTDLTVEDEEVLTALDSLLLPADIRDQVATSLGLKRRPPRLPSPVDSFTGSLILTSMSNGQEKFKSVVEDAPLDTTDEKDLSRSGNGSVREISRKEVSSESEKLQSENDETTVDEEYPEDPENGHQFEEVVSEETSRLPETVTEEKAEETESEGKSRSTEVRSEMTGNKTDRSEEQDVSEASEVVSEAEESVNSEAYNSKVSNIQEQGSNNLKKKEDHNIKEEDPSSESESVHTDSEMY